MDAVTLLSFLLLGSPTYAVREAASEHLSRQPYLAIAVPLELLQSHPDPEIRERLAALRRQHADAILDAAIGGGRSPWLDALPRCQVDRWDIIHGWLGATGCERYRTGDHPQYRGATACWLRWRISEGMTWSEARQLVEKMRARERYWQEGRWTDE